MYIPTQTQRSCARAWVAAANAVTAEGDGYNVVIDVEDPMTHDEVDNKVISHVDSFLRARDQNPVITVSNTIFPQAMYHKYGVPAFYDEYLKTYESLTKTKQWGRYFERMIRNSSDEDFNPLQELIAKIREQVESGKCVKATHELSIYNPLLDRRLWRGGQCLSFLSFKRHPQKGLLLTAIYRNHSYVTRCLGNLIGLGRLLAFVANETGLMHRNRISGGISGGN
jgi:thymidylate synthase